MYTFTYLTDKGDWLCTNHSMCTYTSRCVSMYVFVCVYVCARGTDQDNCFFGGTPVKAWYSYTRTHTDTSKCECMLYTHTHTHTHTNTHLCIHVCMYTYLHTFQTKKTGSAPTTACIWCIHILRHASMHIYMGTFVPIDKGGWFWQSQHIDDTNICMHARTLMYVCIHTSTYLTDTIVTSSASTTTCTYYIHTHTHTHTPIYIYMYVYINLHI